MERKRRQPAPYFRMPGAPFNPATGERAPTKPYEPRGTTLATFQVIGDNPSDPLTADTHDDYILCRGFEAEVDPNFRFLYDPYTAPGTTAISVAKPYWLRGTFPYKRGQIVVAARIRSRIGYNAGKASVSAGQPANLDETIDLLLDDNGVAIAWMDICSNAVASVATVVSFTATADRNPALTTVAAEVIDFLAGDTTLGHTAGVFTAHDDHYLYPRILDGAKGIAIWNQTEEYYQIVACQQQCVLARAQINSAGGMGGGASEVVPIDNFEVMSPSPFNLAPSTLPTSAVNVYRHRGPDNNYVLLAWCEEDDQWEIVDVEKVQVDHIYDLRLDSGYLQAKVVAAAIETNDDPTDVANWTNKIQTNTCPP